MPRLFDRVRRGAKFAGMMLKGISGSDAFDWVTEHPSWRFLTGGAKADISSPMRQSAWVFGAVSGKARALLQAPFVLKYGRRNDRKNAQPLPATDPLAVLMEKPSPLHSLTQLVEGQSAWLDLGGEFFIVKLGAAGFARRGEEPRELLLFPPALVRLNPSAIDPKTRLVMFWTVSNGLTDVDVPADAMIHGPLFNPDNPYRGLAPLEAAIQGIKIEYKADAHTLAMLDNDMTPNGVIAVDQAGDQKKADLILKMWEDMQGGPRKKGTPAVMFKGMQWLPVAWTPKDMAIPQQREVDRDMIRAAFGVTDFELGDMGESNLANSRTAEKLFYKNTIIPRARFIEDIWWFQMFQPISAQRGVDVWAEFDFTQVEALRADFTETLTQASVLQGLGYSPDEINDRLDLGMPAIGDRPMPGSITVGEPTAAPGVVSVTDQSSSSGGALSVVGDGGGISVRDGRGGAWDGLTRARQSRHQVVQLSRRSGVPLSPLVRSMLPRAQRAKSLHVWQRRATGSIGNALAKFYRHLRDGAVETAGGKKDARRIPPMSTEEIERLIGSPGKWRQAAEEYLKSTMDRVALSAVRNAELVIGGFDVVELDDPRWLVEASRRTAEMIRVSMRWRTAIRDEIYAAIASDEGVISLAETIEEKFGEVIRSNGLTIARTEAGMIGSQVRDQVFRAEGIERKEWSSTKDAHTRESHAAIDGETKDLDAPFSNGLMHPCEPGGPPEEIINCRCVSLPVTG